MCSAYALPTFATVMREIIKAAIFQQNAEYSHPFIFLRSRHSLGSKIFIEKRDHIFHGPKRIATKTTPGPIAAVIKVSVVFVWIDFVFHTLPCRFQAVHVVFCHRWRRAFIGAAYMDKLRWQYIIACFGYCKERRNGAIKFSMGGDINIIPKKATRCCIC